MEVQINYNLEEYWEDYLAFENSTGIIRFNSSLELVSNSIIRLLCRVTESLYFDSPYSVSELFEKIFINERNPSGISRFLKILHELSGEENLSFGFVNTMTAEEWLEALSAQAKEKFLANNKLDKRKRLVLPTPKGFLAYLALQGAPLDLTEGLRLKRYPSFFNLKTNTDIESISLLNIRQVNDEKLLQIKNGQIFFQTGFGASFFEKELNDYITKNHFKNVIIGHKERKKLKATRLSHNIKSLRESLEKEIQLFKNIEKKFTSLKVKNYMRWELEISEQLKKRLVDKASILTVSPYRSNFVEKYFSRDNWCYIEWYPYVIMRSEQSIIDTYSLKD